MLVIKDDVARAAVVWLFTGPSNSDDDFERYVESIQRMQQIVRGRDAPAGILVTDPGNPPPDARWRRQIAEASRDVDPNVLFALVSTSRIVRGVVTAINWIRPPTYHVDTFSTFAQATAWIEEHGGAAPHVFEGLLAEARAEVEAGA